MALIDNSTRNDWRRRMRQSWLPVALLAIIAAIAVAAGADWQPVVIVTLLLAAALVIYTPTAEAEPPRVVATLVERPASSVVVHDSLDEITSALSAVDLPLYLIDAQENIVFQSDAAVAAFGAVDSNMHITARLRSPAILDCLRDTIASGRVNKVEFSERHPSTRVFAVTVAPVKQNDSARYFAVSFRDISEARRIEKMRSDFVANASHELRTPLASLQGFIETLQGPAKNDAKAHDRFLSIMLEQVQRMNRLVDDLLSLSRLELKAHIAPSEKIEIGPLVGHVRDALLPLARELDMEINLSQPQEPVYVTGDKDELIQVFENLIQNACKYAQDGKKVDVTVRSASGTHGPEISIRDYGPGIAEEHVPRLTERFYRVNVEASRSKKGTGLGLAIVKHILTRHRARLLVRSELGKGTTFTVRF